MVKTLLLSCLFLLPALGPAIGGSREADERKEILDHIHGIFRAYIAQDREAIEKMHTADWVGFQGPSTGIERGIEAYMRNADRSLASFKGTGYELLDTEVQIRGDTAIVYYVARYDLKDSQGREASLPLRSVDIYCREEDGWNQCGSHITPIPRGGSWGEGTAAGASPRPLSHAERGELLAAREAVWRAWFEGDAEALARHVPEETIALDADVAEWADREGILERSKAFQEKGGKLLRLEFPRTRIQAYGDVAILYTEYLFEAVPDEAGTPVTRTGRGTEVFVRRDGRWLNSGWHLD